MSENIIYGIDASTEIDILHDISYQYNYIKKTKNAKDEIDGYKEFIKQVNDAYLGVKTQNSTALDLIEPCNLCIL